MSQSLTTTPVYDQYSQPPQYMTQSLTTTPAYDKVTNLRLSHTITHVLMTS